MTTTQHTPSPGALAAALSGSRRAWLSILSDADFNTVSPDGDPDRAKVTIRDGLIDWSTTTLAGDVSAYPLAPVAVGGAA
ncbi:hypothetical protein [Pseudactinotalea sp. Z1732]|uniref:hypothetical protein n=1 Tax=Micrococcales TaxID=85006 RepID=UPI003C7BBCC0